MIGMKFRFFFRISEFIVLENIIFNVVLVMGFLVLVLYNTRVICGGFEFFSLSYYLFFLMSIEIYLINL